MRLLRFRADHVPKEEKKQKNEECKRPKLLAYLALSSFLALNGLPGTAHSRVNGEHAPMPPQNLQAEWDGGSCNLENNRLSYRSGLHENGITLDVAVRSPEDLLCARQFSVVLTPDAAVVSLGGDSILEGREMLGRIGERFLVANSYSLGIKDMRAMGITGKTLVGNTLCIETRSETDCVDLSNPVEWRVY